VMYADEHSGRLPYNLGGDATGRSIAPRNNLNWVNNIMTWELDSDNTNTATITESGLGSYASKRATIYRCPGDMALSAVQRDASWTARVRSYSMNAMIGDAGDVSITGSNLNNTNYVQFFNSSAIPTPAGIFVFLDEHPDSINDGYFLNKAYSGQWFDLPASYHNGAASFSFADGHSETHRWLYGSTIRAAAQDAALPLPRPIPPEERADLKWIIQRMSVEKD